MGDDPNTHAYLQYRDGTLGIENTPGGIYHGYFECPNLPPLTGVNSNGQGELGPTWYYWHEDAGIYFPTLDYLEVGEVVVPTTTPGPTPPGPTPPPTTPGPTTPPNPCDLPVTCDSENTTAGI